jgi:hypothetical protein
VMCGKLHMDSKRQQTSCCDDCTLPPCRLCMDATDPLCEAGKRGLCDRCSKLPVCKSCSETISGTVISGYCEPCHHKLPKCLECDSKLVDPQLHAIGICKICESLPKCSDCSTKLRSGVTKYRSSSKLCRDCYGKRPKCPCGMILPTDYGGRDCPDCKREMRSSYLRKPRCCCCSDPLPLRRQSKLARSICIVCIKSIPVCKCDNIIIGNGDKCRGCLDIDKESHSVSSEASAAVAERWSGSSASSSSSSSS